MTASPVTSYPKPTPAERRAWYFKKRADRQRAQYRDMVRGSSSFNHLNKLLLTATPEQAELVNARLARLRAHRESGRRKREERLRAAAEAEQDARLGRA